MHDGPSKMGYVGAELGVAVEGEEEVGVQVGAGVGAPAKQRARDVWDRATP